MVHYVSTLLQVHLLFASTMSHRIIATKKEFDMYLKKIGGGALTSLLIGSSLLYAQEDQTSLSELAVQGEADFAICQSCHDASLNPPKAPPMYGVQRRYKREFENQQEFVDAIVKFVSQPGEEGALMKHPIKKLGLMPALPLGNDNLSKIATYIYEENFEPPCDHWAHAISSEKGKGKHRQHVQSVYDELCK
jgi:hypothetical protein